jgi:hypothetical protein
MNWNYLVAHGEKIVRMRSVSISRDRLEFFVLPKPQRILAPREVHNPIEVLGRIPWADRGLV